MPVLMLGLAGAVILTAATTPAIDAQHQTTAKTYIGFELDQQGQGSEPEDVAKIRLSWLGVRDGIRNYLVTAA